MGTETGKHGRLLRVESSYFVAGAVFRSIHGCDCRCILAAPILGWMYGKRLDSVMSYLNRKGLTYEWVA